MNKLTKKVLRNMKFESETDIKRAIITDLLNQGTTEEIEGYLKNVLYKGCESGIVSLLVYYSDTEAFFKRHFSDIFNLLANYRNNFGEYPRMDELNANSLAWWAYEETCRQIADELEIEY